MLRLNTFGGLHIVGESGPLTGAATQRKPLALLALLAASGERGVSRDKLVTYLWPESDAERARNVLKQCLYALRRDLKAPSLFVGTSELRLNPSVITSDVAEFEALLQRGDRERAVELYCGPFLDGFHLGDAPEFERWVDDERARLAHLFSRAAKSLAAEATERGEHEHAVALWRRLAAADPLNSNVAAGLMRALAAAGDRAGALRHARVHEELLRQELDAVPNATLLALVERLREEPAPVAPTRRTDLAPRNGTMARVPATVVPEELRTALAQRYRIERELGRGGMSTVYLAQDVRHDRRVALKVLNSELAATLGAERFLREIRFAARLQHPHILPLYDSGEVGSTLYYVMPYVEGESLRARLSREVTLSVEEAVSIATEVAEALAHAHARDVVHRDIKPENILFSGKHAVVADFGIARAVSRAGADKLTGTGHAVGTPAYMSPEQASGEEEVDGRSDVYALGCVLYEMLAGEPPFPGPTAQAIMAQHGSEPPPGVRLLRPAVPREVERAIETALAKSPDDRFASAEQFAAALQPVGTARRTRPRRRGPARRWMVALSATGAVALLAVGAWRVKFVIDRRNDVGRGSESSEAG